MTETDPRTPALAAVTSSYASWAPSYIERFGSADRADPEDRALIGTWADGLRGPVLDVGCGPGHWSAFLHERGLEVTGVDATADFVEHATRACPDVAFRTGDLRTLRLADGSLGGVLAWFSLIHSDPREVPDILRSFADALRPGGGLALGYFSGDRLQPFAHRVVTAWAWPVTAMVRAVEDAGLEVVRTEERPAPNGRTSAALTAHRHA
ncbi:MAG: class I SAM-dependent methyltransferase [Acidobacteria bacterium]|nr:class I SAM-dependent methyltransferase [Acidobacteriota bacterium]